MIVEELKPISTIIEDEIEIEKSVLVGPQSYQILKRCLIEAIKSKALKIIDITDYYLSPIERIRVQDGRYYHNIKKLTEQEDTVIETNTEINSDDRLFQKVNESKKLSKKRLIIKLEGAALHIDIYYGRMAGMVKIDIELDKNERGISFEKYENLLKGYDISADEHKVYSNQKGSEELLPYKMMFSNLSFFEMGKILEEINEDHSINQSNLPYIKKILRIVEKLEKKL